VQDFITGFEKNSNFKAKVQRQLQLKGTQLKEVLRRVKDAYKKKKSRWAPAYNSQVKKSLKGWEPA